MGKIRGVIAPILTPFDDAGGIADDLYAGHAKWVLAQGAHYLSPFGTTGEALSVPMSQRMKALENLVANGVSPDRLMPGTGLTSLTETIELTGHATSLGVAATMVLPSFFYTDAGDDGQFHYFEALVNGVDDDRLRICLYNIPRYSGVPISPGLAARLNAAFPAVFVAYKDSTGQWENTKAVIDTAPGLAVFPGTEALMVRALKRGGGGCISATMNLNAAAIRTVFDAADNDVDVAAHERSINAFRDAIQRAGLIPALKSVLAVRYDDRRWLNLRPPLMNATLELGQALLRELGPLADHIAKPG